MAAKTQVLHVFSMGPRLRGDECVREDALSAGWKSPPQAVTACEVESNCAAAMRGGEQLEAKGQPVAKRTRFGGTAWRACSFMAKPRKPDTLR